MVIIKTEGKTKEKKDEVLKGIQAEEKILEYLIQQNRPYNATDLTANLKVIKKVDVIKCLNNLVENQKISIKSFGKQQIYCCLQSKEITESSEELQKIQIELTKGKEELNSLKDQNSLLESQLIQLRNEPTSTQISSIKETLTQQVIELKEKVINLKLNSTHSNPEKSTEIKEIKSQQERNEINLTLEKFKSIYNQRKKIANEVIQTLTDNIEDEEIRNSFHISIGIENDDSELIKLIELNELKKSKLGNPGNPFSGSKKRSFTDCL